MAPNFAADMSISAEKCQVIYDQVCQTILIVKVHRAGVVTSIRGCQETFLFLEERDTSNYPLPRGSEGGFGGYHRLPVSCAFVKIPYEVRCIFLAHVSGWWLPCFPGTDCFWLVLLSSYDSENHTAYSFSSSGAVEGVQYRRYC